jgi:hypothetical protein
MEKHRDGTQQPIKLIINKSEYFYNYDLSGIPKEEFFGKLKDYENYKIKIEYFYEGNLIKESNHIIRNIHRNAVGVMALELD